jgi:phenylacetate-CoA ligase
MTEVLHRAADRVRGLATLRRVQSHDRWSADALHNHQRARLEALVGHAVARSLFYRKRFGEAGVGPGSPISALPPVTKAEVMEHFDAVVCDPRLRLDALERHLATMEGDPLWLGEYRVLATGGTSGRKGVFVYSRRDWTSVVAGTLRWARMTGLPLLDRGRRRRIASIGGGGPQAMSARVAQSAGGGPVVSLRLAATTPVDRLVRELEAFRPDVLVGYATMLALMAGEQLDGRLRIAPRAVLSNSEQLTPAIRERITQAWGSEPFDTYSTTETGPLAAECHEHRGLHLFEDTSIVEVVDARGEPVPPGTLGQRVLVTNLGNLTQPLIRYELTDMLTVGTAPCPCGRPYTLLTAIRGRADDVLELPGQNGSIVTVHPNHLIDAIELHPDARQYQIARHASSIEIHVVPRAGHEASLAETLTAAVRASVAKLGADPGTVTTTLVDELPRAASAAAKHKTVIDLSH